MTIEPECPSPFALDQLVVGELPTLAAASVTQHVDSCARCKERLEQLQRDRETFGDRAPAFSEIRDAALASTPRRAAGSSASWAALAAGLAVAAVLLLWLPRHAPSGEGADATGSATGVSLEPVTTETTRLKGRPFTLSFHVKRGAEVSRGEAGMVLHPGDGLRFTFKLASPGHCGVWGIDAEGVVSPYFTGSELVALPVGSEQPLPGAVALDGTTGQERLVGVVCERPTTTEVVTDALSSDLVRLQPPQGCVVDVVVVSKQR